VLFDAVQALDRAFASITDEEVIEDAIDTASLWIDNNLVPHTSYDDATLAQIEKYLAAHLLFTGQVGLQLVEARRVDVSEKYAEMGKGQTSRHIGVAVALDPSGRVAEAWAGGKRAIMRVGDGYNFRAVS
jgi:EAL domain-containing protein (putative c-di-GMP-specific phosphodiesterase class I)